MQRLENSLKRINFSTDSDRYKYDIILHTKDKFMPTQNTLIYYPAITDIVKVDDLPEFLSFIKDGINSVLSKLYYKDYYFSKNISGNEAFYSLSIVSKTKIAFQVPGTEIYFMLNPDFEDGDISSFPITLYWHWEVMRIMKNFDASQFSFSVQDFFDLGLLVFNISESDALQITTDSFVVPDLGISNFQQLISDINLLYGSNIIIDDYEENKYELLISKIDELNQEVLPTIFTLYIFSSNNVSEGKQKINLFFSAFISGSFEDFVKDLILPKIRATLSLSAAIEFPVSILKPVNADGSEIPDQKTKFQFAQADFYADTQNGFGYQLELGGSLIPTYAAIGNTGLILQIESLKVDLSKTSNIPEADAYGYPLDFVGVYARAISVTFPPKWFHNDTEETSSSSTTLRLGGYDLLVGTGGVSGTVMLESVPVIGPGTTFEYYNDKFTFIYPITIYEIISPETEEVIEINVNDYQELKNVLQSLSETSDAPYPFKYPLSLIPIGQADSIVFDNASSYQYYLASLNNNLLWKKLGGENGFQIGFSSFDITLNKNSVVSSNIAGGLKIAKFTYPLGTIVNGIDIGGQPVQIVVSGHLDGNGDFLLTASTNPPFPIQFGDVFKLHLRSVELGKEGDDFFIGASADLEFLGFIGDLLEGQTINISALRIYSDGSIDFRVNGGNLTLPKPVKLKIGPTELSVTAIHFGSHEREYKGKIRKYNYFGFDGGLNIGIAGIDARGDGIKYYYTIDDNEIDCEDDPLNCKPHDSYLHIQTIYVDMVIPANSNDPSVTIKGWLTIPEPGDPLQEYQGGVDLKIKNPRINGKVDMRLAPKYPAFLIDAAIALPNPIPLGPVSIYGFRGLLGYRYVAEKKAIGMNENNTWYQYYSAPQKGVNVHKFSRPDQTENYGFPFSLGAGAIFGDTMAAGNIISANAMLLLSLPSMVMVDARMKLLATRVSFTDDPPFFAFFIFGDNSLEFGFGADYKFPENSGSIIKLYAEIQAGFIFNNPQAWYINFGTEQQPISAKLLMEIFTLKSYLMLSGKGIKAGARGEFRFDRKFGPVKIFVLAYLELGGRISFQKPQMGAYIEAGLAVEINVKIFRLYAAVSILLAVESPTPFLIYGAFTIEFRIKLFIFKFKFKAKVELKWEFNNYVDRAPINPFTEIGVQEDGLVKGVSMLTNETFDLVSLPPNAIHVNLINKVVPLDTYIDIKTTKGLLPNSEISKIIGGYSNPAGLYTDLIPPEKVMKGLELRQVKHQYSIESIEIMAYSDLINDWVPYNPHVALYPNDTKNSFENLKVGQWQKKDNQYNAIRLLATTPFSYTEQGNPGWFIPEQYGILPSTLFCKGQNIEHSVSDFLDKPLNTKYYASSSNFFHSKGASFQLQGDAVYIVNPDGSVTMQGDYANVSDEPNSFGFAKSLQFPNKTPLTIMLPAPSLDIALELSTYSSGATIAFYMKEPDSPIYAPQYITLHEVYVPRNELANPVIYEELNPQNGVTKIVITPDTPDREAINQIMEQMAVLMDEGYQNALELGGEIDDVQPSNPRYYNDLARRLRQLQSVGCETVEYEYYESACDIYPDLFSYYNNSFNQAYAYHGDLDPDPEALKVVYAEFIKDHLRHYQYVLTLLNSSDIEEPLFDINRNYYASYLVLLENYIQAYPIDYNGIINRFEILKAKYKQIIDWLRTVRSCEDQALCDLSTYLSHQEYGRFLDRPSVSESPLLDAYHTFVRQNPSYDYLNQILDRQITFIQSIIDGGWMVYSLNKTNYDAACNDLVKIISDIGNCKPENKCFTLLHNVSWISVENYIYNINIPGQPAIDQDVQNTIDGMTKSIQPIWRPDTKYYIKFRLRDEVDNIFNQNQYFERAYGFRTAGPLGFFHLDKQSDYGDIPVPNSTNILEDTIGIIRDQNWNTIQEVTPHPDLYAHTNLRAYIDYQRSYPNADGNTVNAKPLFYDDETTEIRLYFNKTYVSKLLEGWEAIKGENNTPLFSELGGTMKIIIKDPVEGTEIVNPPRLDVVVEDIEIPQTIESWEQDDNPPVPPVYNQYFNMLLNNECIGDIKLVKPKSSYRIVTPKKLKPQKLYTVQILNFYWGKNVFNVQNIQQEDKVKYAKEIHKFVFQTSRYKNFEEQVNSCFIPSEDENDEVQEKQAVYSVEKAITSDKIQATFDIINGTSNALSEQISLQYPHLFDRIIEGLLGIAPLEDAVTTEFNKIIDTNTGKIIALLIRNPEPFNHPKIPLEEITRNVTNPGMIEILNIKPGTKPTVNTNYRFLYSKDYSKAIVMNNEKWIQGDNLNFQFIYKTWNGSVYEESSRINTNIIIN